MNTGPLLVVKKNERMGTPLAMSVHRDLGGAPMMDGDPNSPTARLRTGTRDLHIAAERTKFGRAIIERKLTLEEYASQLDAYRTILRALESRLSHEPDARVRGVFVREMERCVQLEDDLHALSAAGTPRRSSPLSRVDAYRQHLEGAHVSGVQLLGHLYVFEGSRLGCALLLTRLESSLHLSEAMSTFYRGFGAGTAAHWQAFSARMDRALVQEADFQKALEAARDAFRRLALIVDTIASVTSRSDAPPGERATLLRYVS